MRQRDKNKQRLLEEIEKLCNVPITDGVATELNVYKGALEAIRMICGEEEPEPKARYSAAYMPVYSRAENADSRPSNRQSIEQWVYGMENVDGSTGPHWSMDQTEQARTQRGIDCDSLQFWAAMNMIYSDYFLVAKKNGANTVDFYAEMAQAFLDDRDAQPNKLARYMEYIAGAGNSSTGYALRMSSGSEFLDAVSGKDQTAAWAVMDRHMRCMKEANPKVYNIVIDKLRNL